MKKRIWMVVVVVATFGAAALFSAVASADSTTDAPAAGAAEAPLPPGWTQEDMQTMIAAGTPGEMHKLLADGIGTWRCETTMWLTPDSEPISSQGVTKVTPLMDGRYIQVEMEGEMPGMGPYRGRGVYGYDNVSQKFTAVWIDNCSTGMLIGTGELSDDGKTITWTYTGNCPLKKGPITMRDVETTTGPNTKTLESFGPDRKTGEEYQVMRIELTRE